MANQIFTKAHESQIKEQLDTLMHCGTAHILLTCSNLDYTDDYNGIDWYTVRACVPYTLSDPDGNKYEDDKKFEISVGVVRNDKRRKVYTALNRSQHKEPGLKRIAE